MRLNMEKRIGKNSAVWEAGGFEKQGELYAAGLAQYQEYLYASEHSGTTVQKYGRDVMHFLRFAENIAQKEALQGEAAGEEPTGEVPTGEEPAKDKNASVVNKSNLVAWKQSLIGTGYAPQTINAMVAAVNGFLEFLGQGHLRVKPVRCQRAVFRARDRELTKPEYLRLLATARKRGKRRLFLVMETVCATGIRISELQYITVQAAREGRAAIRCKGKCRVILIPRKLCRQLLAWAKEKNITAGPVFRTRGGKPIDRSNIWREMRRLCDDARVSPGKVFPHNLRHLFAVVFYKAEKDLAKLADVLGHSSISTTRLYIMETGTEHEKRLSMLGLIIS